jgi:hypothetical protein
MTAALEVEDLIVDGQKVCALTHYELQPPGGSELVSDVAEVFAVQDGKISLYDIYFVSWPLPK